MSQTAPPGAYILQPNTLAGTQGPSGPSGPQPVTITPATAETHYGSPSVGIGDGTGNASTQLGSYLVDGTTTSTLANRMSLEIYNNGSNPIEISTNANFVFGKNQGRTIPAGASYSLLVGAANAPPNVKHYALCGPGNVCSIQVTELGQ